MIPVRAAVSDDAPELARLRGVMFTAMGRADAGDDGPWRAESERVFRRELARQFGAQSGSVAPDRLPGAGGLVAFVVDDPERPGRLAACAIGTLDERLPSPDTPVRLVGHVSNVCTDPDRRRRGYSRACMERLLGWFDRQGVRRVHLSATDEGEGLYRSLGFSDPGSAPMVRFSPDAPSR